MRDKKQKKGTWREREMEGRERRGHEERAGDR